MFGGELLEADARHSPVRMPEDKLDRIEAGLGDVFTEVTRKQLTRLEIFRAIR